MKGNNSHFSATPSAIGSFLLTHHHSFHRVLNPALFIGQSFKAIVYESLKHHPAHQQKQQYLWITLLQYAFTQGIFPNQTDTIKKKRRYCHDDFCCPHRVLDWLWLQIHCE